jgi:hypothetical protein
VRLLSSNVSGSQPLPANGSIQLAFDRLLLPASITRQTFVLLVSDPPAPSYDPVTRVVTVTPTAPLVAGKDYELRIVAPQSESDPYGLRAIDGALLDPRSPSVIVFQAAASGTLTTAPAVDFCRDVFPIFATCNAGGCHGTPAPAAGLALNTAEAIAATAIGRVAVGANQGPRAVPTPPGRLFGEDMAVVDPGSGGVGNPATSWLLYKLLLAAPSGAPPLFPYDRAQWQPLSDAERLVLGTFVTGREMPYPTNPSRVPAAPGLSIDQMEKISVWIAHGATVPSACPGG